MRLASWSVAVLVAFPLAAGCVGRDAPRSEAGTPGGAPVEGGSAPTATVGTGSIAGRVLDADLRPVANVTVGINGTTRQARTGETGDFGFAALPTGPYNLSLAHPSYEPRWVSVAVEADHAATLEVELELIPELRPRYLTWNGHYDCAMEALIIPGDCMILVNNVTHRAENATGADLPDDPVTTESTYLFFNLTRRWAHLVVEMAWTTGGQNQLDGMRLYLAPGNESRDETGHHTKLAVAEGDAPPLRIDFYPDRPHATAENRSTVPASGGEVMVLVFPRGQFAQELEDQCPLYYELLNKTGKPGCFLGVGAGLSVHFTVYVSVFFDRPAPPGYSAAPR